MPQRRNQQWMRQLVWQQRGPRRTARRPRAHSKSGGRSFATPSDREQEQQQQQEQEAIHTLLLASLQSLQDSRLRYPG